MNMLDSGEHLKIAGIEINARPNRCQNGLALSGGPMHGKAHTDKVFDHLLDLLVRCRFLHGNNHKICVDYLIINLGVELGIFVSLGSLGSGRDFLLLNLAHDVHDPFVNAQ